ncbi:hypothetical protein [Nesterenkonia xinjiangensis]|uniref:Uncharacterized protein n=1 Tax=Nesterenkonia xinjiangensis TaxID=225327 RepID=A0A7Z0GLP8_9MICC|nr:hypothetical protein [Nesterenkonia xinjiangensis]NYJ77446.1 hypothetical protein [Nesterenkonia xinjiangensis]
MSTMHGIGGADDWSADSREIRAEASRAEETGAPHRKGWKLALGVLLLLVALGSLVGAVAQYIGESSSGFGAGEPLGLYLIGMLLGGFLFVVVPAVVAAWLLWGWRRGI